MKKIVIAFLIFSISVHKNLGQTNDKDINWSYPYIKTDTISEYCYGHRITDYHRNLENFNDTSVKIWAKKQNELFDTVIHNINYHDSLYHKIEKMKMLRKRWSNFPRVVGNRYFYAFGYFKDNDIERLAYTDCLFMVSV